MSSKTIGEMLDPWKRTVAGRMGIADKTPDEAALLVTERSIIRTKGCGRMTARDIRDAIRSSPSAAAIFDQRSSEDWSNARAEKERAVEIAQARRDMAWAYKAIENGWSPPDGWQWPEGTEPQ